MSSLDCEVTFSPFRNSLIALRRSFSVIPASFRMVEAVLFTQIKITGKINEDLKEKALLSLKRMEVIAKICGYGESKINKQLYNDLEKF